MDFDWKRKERLQEQLKFFGAKKTRFISCYAKKPRIKVKLKPEFECNNKIKFQNAANMQGNLSAQTGLQGLASSQLQVAQAQALAMQGTAGQQAIYGLNRGASLACLVGSAQVSGMPGVIL